MILAADIETVPTGAALAAPYPDADRSPPANYKSEEAIAKWRAGDREAWAASRAKACSLNPRLGRVVAVGYAILESVDVFARRDAGVPIPEPARACHVAPQEGDEARLLRAAWEAVGECAQLVTWNGYSFDLPFLVVRSMVNGVTPPRGVSGLLRRYSYHPHCDVKAALCQWDGRRMMEAGEGLDAWAEFFGLPAKPMPASAVHAAVQAGEFHRVGDYASHDAAISLGIYTRAAGWFGF